jgi:chondroitin AC lyase
MKNSLFFLVTLLTIGISGLPAQAAVRYVKPAMAAATVWEDRTDVYNTIAEAIAAASSDDEIWIAGGAYEIGQGGINYNEAKSLKFYGSFAGTETSIDDRAKVAGGEEWEFQNPTVLKMTAGSTCIWVNNASITATFDGLTLDGDHISGTRGIGVNNAVEVFVTRCIIKNNNTGAANGAGIMGVKQITVDYCWIDHNTSSKASSSKWGSGIMIQAASSSVKHSLISNNVKEGENGGGIGVDNVAGVVISDCRITGNSSTANGGGVIGYRLDDIHNCYIADNTAANGGGIYFRCYAGTGIAYNNLIVNNTASNGTSGVYLQDASGKYITFYNNIVAGNTGTNGLTSLGYSKFYNNVIYDNPVSYSGTNGVFSHNIVPALTADITEANSNIEETNSARLFTDYAGGDYTPPVTDFAGEDKGDAAGLTFADSKDYAGIARVQGAAIEIGSYEITPSTAVTLKSLKIDGILIDGFVSGLTDYHVALQAPATAYPVVTAEPASSIATVSALTYNPATFDPNTTNVVGFTVTNGDNSTAYTISFTVDYMPEISHLILERIRADKLSRPDLAAQEALVDEYLALMQTDGSFSDCHYVSAARDDGEVLNHLIRLREMGIAYTQTGNKYYEDEALYAKIVKGFEYWYSRNWTDSNWWQNRIGHPHRLGEAFIALYGGKKDIRKESVFNNLVTRWRNNMGDPDTPNDATTAGANKCDIAMHWIYRSCLTLNEADLAKAADRSFLIVENTTGEGVQHDWSYRQHGAQLYIGGYGYEFIQLVTRQAFYLAGTEYALSGEKLEILSQFVRNTYLAVIRGQRMSFSTLGRGISRTDNTNQSGAAAILAMLKSVDSAHADVYENAIKRLRGEEPASFQVPALQTHYYRGEYTLQQRPEYTFDVRMVSSRMARSEYDINENREGFFLSDGATGIFVDGEEYGSILPFWNWKKIPGTTVPDLAAMRRADNYIFSGRSSYAGGVTDGQYGVTAFDMVNDQALFASDDDDGYSGTPNNSGTRLPALDFGAKKSWFIFDKEIVCLGAGIYSGHDEPVFTTVNQCRQAGDAVVSSTSGEQTINKGVFTYDNVDWVLNDKVAYFFPGKPDLNISNETKTGSWSNINNNGSSESITGDLFTLWFNHGVKPENAGYAYIVVPDMSSVAEVKSYQPSNIEILANTDSLQVVYHKELNLYGLAFFRAGSFKNHTLSVDASAGCVLLVKDADQEELTVLVADPQKQASPIKLGIKTPLLSEAKAVTYQNLPSPHQGSSQEFQVNNETPEYAGRDVLLDRSDWTIIASSEGPVDAAVAPGGDVPEYIIDGDNQTAFLFVKPGKNYSGVNVPAGTKPSFTIDLKQTVDMTWLLYRHRDYNNTYSYLRASKASFYGKNAEGEDFQPIVENFAIATDVTEVRIDFPEKVSYRYVMFVFEEWDTSNGSTIQVSEFNLGNTLLPDNETVGLKPLSIRQPISIYPNPVKAGQAFTIRLDDDSAGAFIRIYTLQGAKFSEKKAAGNSVEQTIDRPGIYLLEINTNKKKLCSKIIVY